MAKGTKALQETLDFLDALRIQLEFKGTEAMEQSVEKYGQLVPLYGATSTQVASAMKSILAKLSEARITPILGAMEVIRGLLQDFEQTSRTRVEDIQR